MEPDLTLRWSNKNEIKKFKYKLQGRRKKMKNFSKKHGLFVVTAVLLTVIAILVTIGCSNDLGNDDFAPPAGKGAIRLNLNNFNNRSVTPDPSEFSAFDLVIEDATNATVHSLTNDTLANVQKQIVLDPGNYSITVTGKTGSGPYTAVATNSTPVPVFVVAAKTTPVSVILGPITGASIKGTFEYKINTNIDHGGASGTDANDIKSATITLDGGGTPIVIDLITISSGTVTGHKLDNVAYTEANVPAGAYKLLVEIELENNLDTIIFRDVVYIYDGLISTFEFNVLKDYFNGAINITVSHSEDPILSDDGGTTVLSNASQYILTQGTTKTITVKNASAFSSITWYSQDNSSLGTGGSFTLNAGNPGGTPGFFYSKKLYRLTVEGVSSTDGNTYSTYLDIKVQ